MFLWEVSCYSNHLSPICCLFRLIWIPLRYFLSIAFIILMKCDFLCIYLPWDLLSFFSINCWFFINWDIFVCFLYDIVHVLMPFSQSGCYICHPIDHQGWFSWFGWLGRCPLPPSPLHVHSSQNCALGRRGRPSLIEEDQSSVKGIRVAALPC